MKRLVSGREENDECETDTVVGSDEEKDVRRTRGEDGEERGRGRWAWVREWREKVRVPSRSRAREALKRELDVLVREKGQGLPM